MTNFFCTRRTAEYAVDGLAIVFGLLISVPFFILLSAPFWSGQ